MARRTGILAFSVTVGLPLGFAGCTQHYNGALGMKSSEREAAANYQRQRTAVQEGSEAAIAEAGAAAGAPATAGANQAADDVHFRDPAAATDPAANLVAPVRPQYTANMARVSVGPLGLYGQVDAAAPGHSSPLDGGGDISRITFTTEGADFDPDLDPAGSTLIYASTRHRDTADLYLKSVRGTAVTQLTNDPANEVMPAFSPDGRKIAFASDRSGNWDIYMMDARGGQAVQLTNDGTHDIHPSFSPDGRQLVYCSYGAPSGQWELVVIDVENPSTKRVIGHGLFPNWSPVENKIVFQRARQRGTRWFSVWTVGLTDGDVTPPTEIAVSSNAAVITPDWSPDGDQIVFCTVIDPSADEHTRPAQADIWVVGADGANRAKLTEGRYANLQPVWSMDGGIYFVSNRGAEGVENIWAMHAGRASQLAVVVDPNATPEATAAGHAEPAVAPQAPSAMVETPGH